MQYSDGKFPEIFTGGNFPESFRKLPLRCSRIVFYLLIFYRNIYVSGYFYRIIYVFIVLSMFRETFRKFSSLPDAHVKRCNADRNFLELENLLPELK
jgi:hypothetical protein